MVDVAPVIGVQGPVELGADSHCKLPELEDTDKFGVLAPIQIVCGEVGLPGDGGETTVIKIELVF
jgi:hypothetical protein